MMTLLFGIKDVIWLPFCFQNKDTITLRQAFLSICILCKSDEASYFKVTENIKDFRTDIKTQKFLKCCHGNSCHWIPPKS